MLARRPVGDGLGQRLLYASVSGIIASAVIGLPMGMLGMLVMGPAALVGSDSLAVGWTVHLAAGVVFGGALALFFQSRSIARGIGFGLAYGLVIGVVFAWLALFTILGMPYLTAMAALDVGLHVVWGGVLGGVYSALNRTARPGVRGVIGRPA